MKMKMVQKIKLLEDKKRVEGAVHYMTAWDGEAYRVIGPDGNTYAPGFNTRGKAETFAIRMAKMIFRRKTDQTMLQKARTILSNDMLEQIGGVIFEKEDPVKERVSNQNVFERPEEKDEEDDLF